MVSPLYSTDSLRFPPENHENHVIPQTSSPPFKKRVHTSTSNHSTSLAEDLSQDHLPLNVKLLLPSRVARPSRCPRGGHANRPGRMAQYVRARFVA